MRRKGMLRKQIPGRHYHEGILYREVTIDYDLRISFNTLLLFLCELFAV